MPNTFADLFCAVQIMRNFPHPWCICGGWAIDLFINRTSRPHKDVDLAIWRRDQLTLRTYLTSQGWMPEKFVEGQLSPWPEGEFIELPIHILLYKRPSRQPDFIEILLNEANDEQFIFRRNPAITCSLDSAMIQSKSGVPILAPEIVLLYKAKNYMREENRRDFESALPYLTARRRVWLREALHIVHPGHAWLSRL